MLRLGNPFHHQRTEGIHSNLKKQIPTQAKQILQEVMDQSAAKGSGVQIGSNNNAEQAKPEEPKPEESKPEESKEYNK